MAHAILVAKNPNDHVPYLSHIFTCHMLAKCHTREVEPADPVGRCQSSRLVRAEAAIDLLHSCQEHKIVSTVVDMVPDLHEYT